MTPCQHVSTDAGPNIPRVYGSWASEICRDCGAWRTMTHTTRRLDGSMNAPAHVSDWHPAAELAVALCHGDER